MGSLYKPVSVNAAKGAASAPAAPHLFRRCAMLVLVLLPLLVNAQKRFIKAGDKAYDRLAYAEAITSYERAAENNISDTAYARRLAECYMHVRNFKQAEVWYARTMQMRNVKPVDVYNYAQVLRANAKYDSSDQHLARYQGVNASDSRARRQMGSAAYTARLRENHLPGCVVKALALNTAGADMGPTLKGGGIVFASDRGKEVLASRRHAWNGRPFLDLFFANNGSTFQWEVMDEFSALNTKFHESNATFAPDGKTIWFTRNNYYHGHKGQDVKKRMNLKIYSRSLQPDGWGNERGFIHNSEQWSVGHPCVSTDGNTLYFTSDKPGGVGGTDIWKCAKSGATWGEAVNLGPVVNTEGDEMFPWVDEDGTLYFASDGHQGLGGLDVLISRMNADGSVGEPTNPGVPLNSENDDFGLVLKDDGKTGYFTSNRKGGKGDDDIYGITMDHPLSASMSLEGVVTDRTMQAPLQGAVVSMLDADGKVVAETTTGNDGRYAFPLTPGTRCSVSAAKPDYSPSAASIPAIPQQDTVVTRDLALSSGGLVTLWYNVRHAFTGAPLGRVKIDRLDLAAIDQIEKAVVSLTDDGGDVRQELLDVKIGDSLTYYIELSKPGFLTKKGYFRYKVGQYGEIEVHKVMDLCLFPLEPIETRLTCLDDRDHSGLAIKVGRDLRTIIDINPIYFDLNKDNIRPDAALELDKIVRVMQQYPTMEIELGSHTDARGSDASNASLSDRRAKSSAAYIVSKGIAEVRIKGKGYGEMRLLNRCVNGVKCSEVEHQLNRRTEFIITKM
jgi:outer membrane protein OmpA-like peptidoglycan-associated protein/tetratricopeptide (TPR) repeat protein